MYKSEYSQLLVALISAYFSAVWFWGQERREGGGDSQETNRQLESEAYNPELGYMLLLEYIHTWSTHLECLIL